MAELPTFELPKTPTRLWDLSVPIIVDTKHAQIDAYITGSIDEPSHYNELCYLLSAATSETRFYIHINTPGGIIDSAFMVANAIERSKAKVTGCLSGTVASAGTLIAMSCDELNATPHLSFMIHNYSGGMTGKGHEMKARQQFTDNHLNEAFKYYYTGFLSNEEMQRIIDGTDMWMSTSEVERRWLQKRNCN